MNLAQIIQSTLGNRKDNVDNSFLNLITGGITPEGQDKFKNQHPTLSKIRQDLINYNELNMQPQPQPQPVVRPQPVVNVPRSNNRLSQVIQQALANPQNAPQAVGYPQQEPQQVQGLNNYQVDQLKQQVEKEAINNQNRVNANLVGPRIPASYQNNNNANFPKFNNVEAIAGTTKTIEQKISDNPQLFSSERMWEAARQSRNSDITNEGFAGSYNKNYKGSGYQGNPTDAIDADPNKRARIENWYKGYLINHPELVNRVENNRLNAEPMQIKTGGLKLPETGLDMNNPSISFLSNTYNSIKDNNSPEAFKMKSDIMKQLSDIYGKNNPSKYEQLKANTFFNPDGSIVNTEKGVYTNTSGNIAVNKQNQLTPMQKANITNTLSDNYRQDPIVKNYKDTVDSVNRVDSVWNDYLQNPDKSRATLDQTLGVALQKMLDPGSVVREGEFARTEHGQAVLSQAQAYLPKLAIGGMALTDDARQDIITTIHLLKKGAEQGASPIKENYTLQAQSYGIDPAFIVGGDVNSRGTVQALQGNIPKGAIKALIMDPNLKQEFDNKYGAGASDSYI